MAPRCSRSRRAALRGFVASWAIERWSASLTTMRFERVILKRKMPRSDRTRRFRELLAPGFERRPPSRQGDIGEVVDQRDEPAGDPGVFAAGTGDVVDRELDVCVPIGN